MFSQKRGGSSPVPGVTSGEVTLQTKSKLISICESRSKTLRAIVFTKLKRFHQDPVYVRYLTRLAKQIRNYPFVERNGESKCFFTCFK